MVTRVQHLLINVTLISPDNPDKNLAKYVTVAIDLFIYFWDNFYEPLLSSLLFLTDANIEIFNNSYFLLFYDNTQKIYILVYVVWGMFV